MSEDSEIIWWRNPGTPRKGPGPFPKDGEILGLNTRYYPAPDCSDGVQVSVVLVAGAIGDYAAYAGSGPPEWIKCYGDKLSFEEARVHFPGSLVAERYRP